MESNSDLMEKNSIIILMKYLSRSTSRQIIKFILESPKDLYEIRKLVEKKKSTVFEVLRKLEDDGIIKSHLIKVGKYGRKRKQYYIDDIQIPRITRKAMLDFLHGKDITFKEELIEFAEIMQSLENVNILFPDGIRVKLSPEILLIEMLNAGFTLREILPIFLNLRDRIRFETDYDDVRNEILKILREGEFSEGKIKSYSEVISKDITVEFSSGKLETRTVSDLVSIAENELNVSPYEAIFVVENSIRILKSLDVNFIVYPHLVMFMYFLAQERSIPCRKPDFLRIFIPEECELFIAKKGEAKEYQKFILPPVFEKNFPYLKQLKILDNKNGSWTREDILKYLLSNFKLEKNKAELLSYEIFNKMKYLNLPQNSLVFLNSLVRELIRVHGF